MTRRNLKDQVYPACVGLGRTGSYPNRVHEVWNDQVLRPVPFLYMFIPMRWLDWNNKGVMLKWNKN
jgi:hypothetical protein